MSFTTKLLSTAILIHLVSTKDIFYEPWEPGTQCSKAYFLLMDNFCTCSRQTNYSFSYTFDLAYLDWSSQTVQGTVAIPLNGGANKFALNGLYSEISIIFMEWFYPQLLQCSPKNFSSVEFCNFCPDAVQQFATFNTTISFQFGQESFSSTKNCLGTIKLDSHYLLPLSELDFSLNRLTQIPNFDLAFAFESFQTFDVSNNLISTVSRNDFKKIPTLQRLNVSMNKLSHLPPDLIVDLSRLERLDFSHNLISQVPVSFFRKNPDLRELYLNNNNLSTLPKNFITSEYVSQYLKDNSMNWDKLQKLYDSNNASWAFKKIIIISLSYNSFTTIPEIVFLFNSVDIELNNNKITTLDLPIQQKLKFARNLNVDISHNCIQNVENGTSFWSRNSKVSIFKCTHCCLDIIHPGLFAGLTDRLDISHNNITELDLRGLDLYPENRLLELNLSHNQISILPKNNDLVWSKIGILDLSHNKLESLQNLTLTSNLYVLHLDYNSLTELGDTIETLLSGNLISVKLAGNPWSCDCKVKNLVIKSPIFTDKHLMTCVQDGIKYNFTEIDRLCIIQFVNSILLWSTLPFSIIFIFAVLTAFYYKFKKEILYFLFSKGLCLNFVCEEDIDADKEYDAFVSYSFENQDWVSDFLIPGLEYCTPPYKVCDHNRDWLGGLHVIDQIEKSVQNSRRTIIVLTDGFLRSMWGRTEFDFVYQQGLKDNINRLLVVVPDEVPDLSLIDDEFRSFIQLTTYIQANKPHFWMKLKASMPRHPSILTQTNIQHSNRTNPAFDSSSPLQSSQ